MREQLERDEPDASFSAAEPDAAAPRIYGGGSAAARLAGLGFGESTRQAVERGTTPDRSVPEDRAPRTPSRGRDREDGKGHDR